jgi:hypothetical protein
MNRAAREATERTATDAHLPTASPNASPRRKTIPQLTAIGAMSTGAAPKITRAQGGGQQAHDIRAMNANAPHPRVSKPRKANLDMAPTKGMPSAAPNPPRKAKAPLAPISDMPSEQAVRGGRKGQLPAGAQAACADPPSAISLLIGQIIEAHRRRDDFIKAANKLTLQVHAICRAFVGDPKKTNKARANELYNAIVNDTRELTIAEAQLALRHLSPLLRARDMLAQERLAPEKELRKLAEQLPIWAAWARDIKGFGALGLGQIIAEAGDLNRYANPAKLWTRMGVGLDPIGGGRQRLVAGVATGYVPRRRSVLWVIGDAMIKAQGPYREIYLARKAYGVQQAEAAGLIVAPALEIPKGKESAYRSQGHCHNRAKRYAEKMLLKHLWQEWRKLRPAGDQ